MAPSSFKRNANVGSVQSSFWPHSIVWTTDAYIYAIYTIYASHTADLHHWHRQDNTAAAIKALSFQHYFNQYVCSPLQRRKKQRVLAVPPLITAIQPVLALPCLAYTEHLMGGDMYQKSESLASNNRGPIYHVIDLEKGVLNQDSWSKNGWVQLQHCRERGGGLPKTDPLDLNFAPLRSSPNKTSIFISSPMAIK